MNNVKNLELNNSTEILNGKILNCECVDDLRLEILPQIKTQKEQWQTKINEIIEQNGYNKTSFAKKCKVSRQAVNGWKNGIIPKNREQFIKIGMAACYNVEQMNFLLTRYGRYSGLYSKNLEDCICIFVLNSEYGENALEIYDEIHNEILKLITNINMKEVNNLTTYKFNEKLSQVKNYDDLEKFIIDNAMMFTYEYYKFYAYVNMFIKSNYTHASNPYELANAQGWSSSLRQSVSNINQKKWGPTRNKIISLGLHLSMDRDQIDNMLELAHMEPLCANNIFESVIIFILEDASLNNMLEKENEDFNPDDLCIYAKRVIEEINIPEVNGFMSEIVEIDKDDE